MMSVELLKDEYKTPLAVVRGVFLCEDVAAPVSALGAITQDDWSGSVEESTGGGTNPDGNISLVF
jgi:hypothetical protein